MKQTWIEVVRGRPQLQEKEETTTTIDKGRSGEGMELEIEREREKPTNRTEDRGKTLAEEEDGEESPDPFNLWDIIGKKPMKNRRLWEKMGELVAEEFQGLQIQSPTAKLVNTERAELPRDGRVESQATEEFMKQLKETEYHSDVESEETERRAEEDEELYSPSTYDHHWGEDTWTKETILARSQTVGLQVHNNQEKIMKAWEARKNTADRRDTHPSNQ